MIKLMDMHNHTIASDGHHSPEEIIENAIAEGIDVVGISDHFATYKCKSVEIEEMDEYIRCIDELKSQYNAQIEILCGIEICMNESWVNLRYLPYEKLNQLDYVLFEYIDQYPNSVRLDELNKYASRITCRKGLAHTDIFNLIERYGMEDTMKYLKQNSLFWEINVNERYAYFNQIIKKPNTKAVKNLRLALKENHIEMTVGSDTHYLESYNLAAIQCANQWIANI